MDEKQWVEVYKATWEYVRHNELLRFRFGQWYVAIVGGLLAIKVGVSGGSLPVELEWVVFPFLVLYSVLGGIYLISQRQGYLWYVNRIERMEELLPRNFQIDYPRGPDPFRLFFTVMTIVGAGISAYFVYLMVIGGITLALDRNTLALVLSAIAFSVYLIGFQWHYPRASRRGQILPGNKLKK